MQAFGDAEVAALIAQGWRVTGVRGKGAIMREMPTGNPDKPKTWGFVGYSVVVTLVEPDTKPRRFWRR
jgi:hypothetical protein